ncbi:hypothetical protein [Halocynthiibacter namhaensis]|uniref:hypothetical protein n=1 Tax=Halocynthiibacter namhaensis TaxID=1290553 RepID=UPI0005795D42|nr:hypothetical protein [Halocynthiibacter namhaensis]
MVLSVGDSVKLDLCDRFADGQVVSLENWVYIGVRTWDGHAYIQVCMNISAVLWSRIVQLGDNFPIEDAQQCREIAEQISFQPKRLSVVDVPRARRLFKPEARLIWEEP